MRGMRFIEGCAVGVACFGAGAGLGWLMSMNVPVALCVLAVVAVVCFGMFWTLNGGPGE